MNSIDNMEPIGGAAPQPTPTPPAAADTSGAAEPQMKSGEAVPSPVEEKPVKEKVNWGQKFLDNKMTVLIGLVVLILGGVAAIWLSLENEAATSGPVAAASTEQMDALTQTPTPPDTKEPIAAVDQAMAEDARPDQPEELVPEQLLTSQPQPKPVAQPEYTAAEQAANRQRAAETAHANNTEQVQVTRRDPSTGQYTQQTTTRQRVAVGTSPRRQEWSATSTGNMNAQSYAAPRPTRDKDGTLFETNDEINMMLSNLPKGVHENYERMTGRRFRPLLASQQQQVSESDKRRAEMAYIPGMDGFNTVRYRGSNANPADEEMIMPDIFYRCSIQGTQLVRTGSVVMLRLSEEATFGGVTFPRNMVFAALATVESNRVTLTIDRLGQYKVGVEVYNYSYMPGIMIDPAKRVKPQGQEGIGSSMTQAGSQEISTAILQSSQAANSWQGIAGRAGVTMLGRLPKGGVRLRDVTLPDGYPVLLTRTGRTASSAYQQGGVTQPTGPMGQDGNPMQSPLLQGVGQGGYPNQPGYDNLPPAYATPMQMQQAQRR
ncbi:conjugative transposon protein TraM [Hymenobacter sp. DG01]|uniref:conjugative transposon protein TraM n=1 Tax=Hymenobacter sp. DG01 TaxID=2584940 RepID=UPI001121DA91|nr:conjugative transposon protein TraM [Hymenobacter sp. DG01]